ncbi:unnamed protein product [Schistosoma haematobium]|nr:unnamed protein product [Schistosoma haematobium]
MRLQAHAIRTRLLSHIPVAKYGCRYASATSRTVNNRYGVGLFLYYMHATPFFFLFFPILSPRLRPSPSGTVDFSQLWRKLARSLTHLSKCSVDISVSNVWYMFGLELGRYGRFWFIGSTRFRPTSAAFLVRIPYERNLQILDTNHSGMARQLKQQVKHTAPGTVLRKRTPLATRRSTIAFLFRQFRPTIARQPISPTI